jgi:acetoin utilization deacetylase AcuC-like enzyme
MIGIYYSEIFLKHDTGYGHPERPERLQALVDAIQKNNRISEIAFPEFLPASKEDLLLVHTEGYIEIVENAIRDGHHQLPTGDTRISKKSWEVALLAVGAVKNACEKVMAKEYTFALCLVRPPGHHANANKGMGFCIFNNIAIGARYLQKRFLLKKILIVDFDVHHGNGTQDIFYEDNSVFYFSVHAQDIYPGTGKATEIGANAGKGFTLNVELNSGAGDEQVLNALKNYLLPVMKNFHPEFILVSAGFDAHKDDPLGNLNYTAEGYGKLAKELIAFSNQYANGHILFVLEGGYNLNALATSVEKILENA